MIRTLPASLTACLVSFGFAAMRARPALAQTRDSLPSNVALISNVMVPMRDGVRLATDVYLPARDRVPIPGRYPTILRRTPYGKSGWDDFVAYLVARGYAFVSQDTRGRYGSEGVWQMLAGDGHDGADACNWIGQQAWSNGKIGMFGGSYEGGTQHAIALEGCKYLKTIVPLDAAANPGYAGVRYAGAFELRMFNWIFLYGAPQGSRASRDSAPRVQLEKMRDARLSYLAKLPLQPGETPLHLAPEYEAWLLAAMQHGGHDDFWKLLDVVDSARRYQDMPVYFVGGWYDSWGGSTATSASTLARVKRGPIYLIMGPWTHGGETRSFHGQVSFGDGAAIPDFADWHREWFDRWLKDSLNSVGKSGIFAAPVRIFVMGTGDGHKDAEGRLFHGGYWRNEKAWPLARARSVRWYLHAGRTLSTSTPNESPSDSGAAVTYRFDPTNPVPTIGGNVSSSPGMMENGGWDQRGSDKVWNWPRPIPLSSRPDVQVFESAPLDRDIEVTGPIEVVLWASSDALDTDFTAKLVDEYPRSAEWPEGIALNLEDGIVRARFRDAFPNAYRDGTAKESLLTPGKAYRYTIRMYPTSNVFKRGHRIRVDVSSSNYPRFDVNPNTGEPLGKHTHMQSARNTIHLDRRHPSYIILPIVSSTSPSDTTRVRGPR